MPDTHTAAPSAPEATLEEVLALPQVQLAHISEFTPFALNAREHPPEQIEEIAASIAHFGWVWPILRRGDQVIGAGHGRREAAALLYSRGIRIRMWNGFELPFEQLPFFDASSMSEAKFKAFILVDNRSAEKATWSLPMLRASLDELGELGVDLSPLGFALPDLDAIFGPAPEAPGLSGDGKSGAGSLAARFGVAPFSVLNAREGWWQERKAAWLALGISSEVGRGDNLIGHSLPTRISLILGKPYDEAKAFIEKHRAKGLDDDAIKAAAQQAAAGRIAPGLAMGEINHPDGAERSLSGTSVFDPVLCELAYRWFCPVGGIILDPFAGGSVRGIVAAKLGREYVGFELRAEQVEANRAQASEICGEGIAPAYVEGDSRLTISAQDDLHADFVFSCPPYGDLEVYSEGEGDLSNMEHAEFIRAYREIIAEAVARLKPNRFAAFVVGDFRDAKGLYRNFVSDTIAAFQDAGAILYNEAILVTSVGSLPIRAAKQFSHSRKLGKSHQNVLVFVKGDPVKATAAVGEVEFGDVEKAADAQEDGSAPAE